MDRELECMAKAVHHEASNQTLKGQLAVAQLILNRTRSDVFPKTICAVINQRGQFFHTGSYRAPVRSPNWRRAIAVARLARQDAVAQIVPGALFYHADYVRPNWSHKHTRLAQIGAHIFYR
jgi:spore germination cell wall hydrolase CwlJ-like protein